MEFTRRTIVAGAVASPLTAALAGLAKADNWPSSIIKIIVPFPPGGSVDPIARMAQPGLQQKLNATLVIENRAGSSGSVGTEIVAKSPPDGYTWVFVFDTHAVNPFLFDLKFDTVKDLEPVMLIGTAPNVLATHPSRPYKSFADVVAAAKEKPGVITYASIGSGSVGHLTMTLLSQKAGCKLVHVPYRGGGPAMNDAIAGHVDLIIGSAALVMPQVNAKTIVPLLQTGKTRIPNLPNVQTAIEAGFTNFESYAWWGVFAPAGTPKPIVDRFAAALGDALRDPIINKTLSDSLQVSLRLGDGQEEAKFLAEQMALWGPVVKDNDIKSD
ncbi:MAG TPA: tripartite tricarboxylate transporter substrate binding protein [Xanthobacteraceae bacterium]|jgi:tripartite-type tricarboxylate transporter receptor subunit TctC|nr:tripartite tricarboxylate transporter substrate binding protein [Xanthobacteraceae bacterium]